MKENIYNIIRKEYEKRRINLLCKNSKSEKHFSKLLNSANIFYIQEKCCFNKFGRWCYIDFYLPFYKLAIEIDGIEHNSGERYRKDLIKTKFLHDERDISTIRYTNRECLSMRKISLIELIKKSGRPNATPIDLQRIKTVKMNEMKESCEKYGLDINDKYWVYDKSKDCIFTFKDIYMLKHSTGTKYKYLANAIHEKQNIHASHLYIISNNEEDIKSKIDQYYEYLWNQ